MTKPKLPKKPSKNDAPPNRVITVAKWLGVDYFGKVTLVPDDCLHEGYPIWDKLESRAITLISEKIDYDTLTKVYALVGKNFNIITMYDNDGYNSGLSIEYQEIDKNYESKQIAFNNRFVQYEQDLKDYGIKLNEYNSKRAKEKLLKLQLEIKELVNNEKVL